jgi:hypothetical protein
MGKRNNADRGVGLPDRNTGSLADLPLPNDGVPDESSSHIPNGQKAAAPQELPYPMISAGDEPAAHRTDRPVSPGKPAPRREGWAPPTASWERAE